MMLRMSRIGTAVLVRIGLAGLVCLAALPNCYASADYDLISTIGVNPVTNKIYIANPFSGTVTVRDGATGNTTTVPAGNGPWSVAVNPVTNKIYVVNVYGANMTVIDGATNNTTTVPVGQGPIFVGVNPVTNKIYVANEYGSTVSVIDGVTNNTVTVPAGSDPQAAIVNTVTNKIYIPNEDSQNVTVIDGATNNTTTIAAAPGSSPYTGVVNEATNKIYIVDQYDNNVTVIDGATNNTTTVPVGGDPQALAVNPVTNKIYVANNTGNSVTVIDGATNNTTTIPVGAGPIAVAVNPVTNQIYVANGFGGNVTLIDGATNNTTTITGVMGAPVAVAVNQVTNKVYVANVLGNASELVIDGDTNIATTIAAGSGPWATALNPVTNKVYVGNQYSSNVTVIDGVTGNTTTVATGGNPIAIAVNPFTNKIYVANNGSSSVTVIDGVTNNTTTVAVGTNPWAVAVNPVTNKIYVANANSGSVTVIDGVTNNTTSVAAGSGPWTVAVNPVTNKIYAGNLYSGNVTVIDGATNNTTTVATQPSVISIAVNPVTNKIYVIEEGGNVTVIDGATNNTTNVTTAANPISVAVNPVTNQVYVANQYNNIVTVIYGATNQTTTVATGGNPISIAVDQATNKIFVANEFSTNVTVIDGVTNTPTNVAAGSYPYAVAVNPITNTAYVANYKGNTVTVITEEQKHPIPLTTTITSLPGNETSSSTPAFTFSVSDTYSPMPTTPDTVYYQADTLQGHWSAATGSNPSYVGTLAALQPGFHILYAYAGDSQEAESATQNSPIAGAIQAYAFLYNPAAGPQLPAPTVTFTGAPASAAYNSMFTVSATTNASTTASIIASGACSISGSTVTMTSGTGTCSLTANWAADSNYSSATANQSTTATKIAPTVTFTGAPASATYNSMFAVSATTNASTTASITPGGACSVSGNNVTMTSGTGVCSLTANWAADSNYLAAMANQSTTASKATPTVTFTGAPASAANGSMFNVTATTNASTTASITAMGSCSISGNTVTMTSGTGTCSLTANWTADSNYIAASANQSTTANSNVTPAPMISNVMATGITTMSATVTWNTDQLSSSQAAFGTTTAYGTLSALNSTLVTSHSVTITGLTPGTTYDFAVTSADSGGATTSGNFAFTTLSPSPATTIAPVGGASNNTGSSTPTSLSISYASGNGNTIVAVCALGNTASSILSITDNGSVWAQRAFVGNGASVRSEIWSTGAGGSVASTSFKINMSAGSPASCALEEYSGVVTLGPTATASATSGTMTVGLTTQDANDYLVAGLGANSYNGYFIATGTLRQTGGYTPVGNYVEMDLCDNTAATATAVNCTNISGPAPWAAPALELRPGTGGGGSAPVISAVTSSGITPTSATISWTTNQASSSQVKYGTTIAYGSLSALNSSLVTTHSVPLTGLTAGTTYNFAVVSVDSSGTATSANFTFSTPVTVPVISAVVANGITPISATISWTTDQSSSSQVAFGLTTSYGTLSALNSSPVTSHSVPLTGLAPGTTYNFDVMSGDSAGTATSANFTFSTPLTSATTTISPVGGASNTTGGSSSSTSLPIAYSSGNGNTIVAVCALGNTASSISSITDSGSVWTFQAYAANGTSVRSEIWSTGAGSSVASASFTVNFSAGTPAACSIEEYSGVATIGPTATASGTSGTWAVGLTTQDPNDYVVAGLGANAYYSYSFPTGTIRQTSGVTSNPVSNFVELGLCDNTAATASAVTCSVITASAPWAAPALELRPGAGGASAPVISAVTTSGITTTSVTITWTTSQPSSSQVLYGPTTPYGYSTTVNSALVTLHSVTVNGLASGTTYNFAVVSADSGGSTTSGNFSFSTPALVSAPVISAVTSSGVTATSVTITWTTDQPSSSQVLYGPTTPYGYSTTVNSALVTLHSVTVNGLASGTTYNFAVVSADSGGSTTSGNFSFSTPVLVTVPVISAVTVTGITTASATITWTTDQLSSSQVLYGATTPYGYSTTVNSTLVTAHSVIVAGLAPGTTYNFAVVSADSAGSTTSANFSFSTISAAAQTTFCFIGDGLTVGFLSSPPTTPVAIMIADLNAWTGTNAYAAVNEGEDSTASGDWANGNNLTMSISACSGLTTMFYMIGTNDAKTAVATPPATYRANVQSTITGLEAAGFTRIILNYSPWINPNLAGGWDAGSDTLLLQYESELQSLAAADPTHVFVGDTTAFNYFEANPSLLEDGVHLTGPPVNAGYTALAQLWALGSLSIIGAPVPIPTISAVTASGITTTSATITWTTNIPSSSQVGYGITTGYGSLSALNSSWVTSHSVTVTGLTPGTTYDYAVTSSDSAGTATSANFTFSTPQIQATISPVGGAGSNTGGNAAAVSLTIPYASGNGTTMVAVCALGNTAASISSITDSGSVWAFRAFIANGTAVRTEIWSTNAGGSIASTSFTINLSGGSPASCALEEYAGVLAIGATATNESTSGTTSVSLTTQDSNNYMVAGLGANSFFGYYASAGTIRQNAGLASGGGPNYVEIALCDNTSAVAASITCSSVSSSAPWAAPALELRSASASGGVGPVISAVTLSGITATSATVTWTTNQPSSSQVAYGTAIPYGYLSTLSSTLVTSHSVTLGGLTPGTAYDIAAISADAAGTTASPNFTFSTPASSPPVITAVTASGVTTTTVTITWTTDQPSSSQVEYGPTIAYGTPSALNSALVTLHSVTLTGLLPGTTYNFAVISTAPSGTSTSGNFSFSTSAPLPVISTVATSGVTTTTITITWTTDQASSSQVAYGATTAYGMLSALNSSLVTLHSVTLTGLLPGTTYNFAVISTAPSGTSTSSNFTFSTSASVPVISAVTSSGVTTTTVTVTWTTDQASSSQVAYGATTAYGMLSTLNSSLVTLHSVTLTGLTAGTTYDFDVMSTDSAGTATSGNFTFTTSSNPIVAAISPVGGAAANSGAGAAPVSLSINYSSGKGNTIVAVCALGNTAASISSITDGGSVWAFRAYTSSGSAVRSEIWSTTASGSVASKSFTINLSVSSPMSCALEEYTGATLLGTTATNQGNSSTMSVSLTTQEANDYIVAGLGANTYNGFLTTAGTVRQSGGLASNPGGNYVEMNLCDNTAAAATSLTCSSVSGSAPFAAPALVLR